MYSSILSASVFGLTARKIRVEADVSNGLPGAVMVGYLAGQVRETMDRVRTAQRFCAGAKETHSQSGPGRL